ncbi:hypothetical protein [Pseudomonas sp. NPDC089741]
MTVLDQITSRWSRGRLRAATVPLATAWAMLSDLMS